jgi:hypothetical protein
MGNVGDVNGWIKVDWVKVQKYGIVESGKETNRKETDKVWQRKQLYKKNSMQFSDIIWKNVPFIQKWHFHHKILISLGLHLLPTILIDDQIKHKVKILIYFHLFSESLEYQSKKFQHHIWSFTQCEILIWFGKEKGPSTFVRFPKFEKFFPHGKATVFGPYRYYHSLCVCLL